MMTALWSADVISVVCPTAMMVIGAIVGEDGFYRQD
jgi:hypothetical protein